MKFKNIAYKEHFNNKNVIVVIIIIIMGVAISAFSPKTMFNFWNNFDNVLTNSYSNAFLFLATIINIRFYLNNNSYKYNLVLRYGDYREYAIKNIRDLINITLYVYISYLIINVAFSLVFSYLNFSISNPLIYFLHLIFFLIRQFLFLIAIQTIYYLILESYSNSFSIFILLVIILHFFVSSYFNIKIRNVYLIFSAYLQTGMYSSILEEIIYSMIYLIIFLCLCLIIGKFLLRKKGEIGDTVKYFKGDYKEKFSVNRIFTFFRRVRSCRILFWNR